MSIHNPASPVFGGKLRQPEYYAEVNSIINVLRGRSTLAVIAKHLAAQGFQTPSGKTWSKERLATYLRSTAIGIKTY